MSDTVTPVCDLIEQLMSTGMSPGDAIAAARIAEPAIATGRAVLRSQRERWRIKKQRQRARNRGDMSPGTISTPIINNNRKDLKKERKKESVSPFVPLDDGWPVNHLELFWKAFPPFRRQAKAKVAVKLSRLRSEKTVTWDVLIDGVRKFAATKPGEYAPAPMVWLNDGRWDREYGPNGGSDGKVASTKVGFSGIAARLRYGSPGREEPFRPAPEDLEPINRR